MFAILEMVGEMAAFEWWVGVRFAQVCAMFVVGGVLCSSGLHQEGRFFKC